ncbi:hypothetical protein SPWS13_3147 [Shewanella putrefaciens]|nr:hypothetical protein SPWS13_3147 [Shewanella putrefaciens]
MSNKGEAKRSCADLGTRSIAGNHWQVRLKKHQPQPFVGYLACG